MAVLGLDAIAQLLMMLAYPFWSLSVFAVDIIAIYGSPFTQSGSWTDNNQWPAGRCACAAVSPSHQPVTPTARASTGRPRVASRDWLTLNETKRSVVMHGELLFGDSVSSASRWQTRSEPGLVLLAAVMTIVTSAVLLAAAILAPAPEAVVPFVVIISIGCPVLASWQIPPVIATLRSKRFATRALSQLRRGLAQLPETEHPLGRDA